MQPSEEIKSRLDIVDVIREYIQLQAAGVNFRAKCPFHREKTPSFVVSPEKQIYHCFGCGEGGDLFSFVMKMEGIEFVEALRLLAPKAGVALKKQNPEAASKRNKILDILELSRRYYHKIFLEEASARNAREYIKKRELSADTIEEWQIGYSPDSWDTVGKLLRAKGYKENEIFVAGLIVKSNKNNRFYDRFRSRIMFPINDINGNTVAFSARVSPEKEATEQMGKYINSPQTPVYDKSKILFGLDKAKLEIKKEDLAIVVEGQMDAISAHQAGFKNVVASSGTALTTEQIQLLKRFSNNIALAFDMDAAGEMATERGIREAMRLEMNIKIIEVPNGKDPDDCIRENPNDWVLAVKNAKSMMEYYFAKTFAGLDMLKLDDKRGAAKILLPIIAGLKNVVEKDHWLKELSNRIDVGEPLLRESITTAKPRVERTYGQKKEAKIKIQKQAREEKISEYFLALLLKFNSYLGYAINYLQVEQIFGQNNQEFYKNLIIYYNNSVNINLDDYKEWLKNIDNNNGTNTKTINQLKLLNKLVILVDEEFSDIDEVGAKSEIISLALALKKQYYLEKMKGVEKLIIEAEKQGDENKVRILMEDFKSFSEEVKELKNSI
ncbi:DNA primase [Candidatus Parcubacteria bacterium]|nr:DNA primase [Candidatus Parcubacteria bacterium]